ncbi:mannosyl-oligosaccharide 1,2-alpha-mannosidase MNS3 [Tanacetum coccineum]
MHCRLSISPSPTYFGGLFSRKSWAHANEGLKRPSLAVKASSKGEKSILKGGIRFKRLLRKPPRLPPRLSPYEKVFLQAWYGYKMYAMGSDELMSLSKRGIDGLGDFRATVVDALDTKMIMKLDDVVKESGSWIEKNLLGSSSKKGQVNLFETAIRVVGGLLSAYLHFSFLFVIDVLALVVYFSQISF